ncbi:endonuclease/exonuclease/phosphatase family protein [Nannocystis pusilla]|uniref:Endonuclease/exonuclease/phosphatase family protein n=1 Tax=Nannocystis pusilla TaxID=889268 RepID=A0ABS7TR26_9BACT|nr:endonuclease/exonuclease/phosphatase family protein [Nannocystis pusilla]MBZ5710679.1 endonuclease/exonuclease/phosphatase family protein [Nannocystis pusilla]
MTRVLSLNLNFYGERHGPWCERRALVAAAIREARPDLVALQAVARAPDRDDGLDQAAQLGRCVPGYEVVYRAAAVHADGREEGLAFLSRYPLLDLRVHALSRRDDGEDTSRRALLHGLFAAPGGPLHLVDAHFSWVEAQARDNVSEALAYLAAVEGPAALVGDFNQTPTSEALARLRDAGLVDAWAALRPEAPGYTFYEDGALRRRIDYQLLDRRLAPQLRRADLVLDGPGERRASDHAGLLVTIDDPARA